MKNELALTINGQQIVAPPGIPQGNNMLWRAISLGIEILLVLAVLLTLTFLVWGGIDMITSEGDKQKFQNAKNKIKYAMIGLVVSMLSFGIIGALGHLFKINLI